MFTKILRKISEKIESIKNNGCGSQGGCGNKINE